MRRPPARSLCVLVFVSLAAVATTACRLRTEAAKLKDDDNGVPNVVHLLDLTDQGSGVSQMAAFSESASFVKFVVTLADQKVYFQNTNKYPYHYNAAAAHIPEFQGATPQQFDAATLRNEGRKAISGTLLFRYVWGEGVNGFNAYVALQLVSEDVLPTAFAVDILKLVRTSYKINNQTPVTYYFPTTEQRPSVAGDPGPYADAGFTVGSMDDWLVGNACYAHGWAAGRLVALKAAQIDSAYAAGQLRHDDILLATDGVPAEIPTVAGVVTLAPSTPNSHVALLAQSYRLPFVYLKDDGMRAFVQAAAGKDVMLATGPSMSGCEVKLRAVELAAEDRAVIRDLRKPKSLDYPHAEPLGTLTRKAAAITPKADAKHFGGKASNMPILLEALPNNSPQEALGVSFDLWLAHREQTYQGQKLKDYITAQLVPFGTNYPPADVAAVKAALKKVRKAIEDTPLAKKTQLLNELQSHGLDDKTMIRFRSSTNMEDGDTFSGAGLYESKSGCLGDDLDEDDAGPSRCDAAEAKEKPVAKAITKVFASLYNDNAYLERRRHGVDDETVAMGLAVNYSYPDAIELANGVMTLTAQEFGDGYTVKLVQQKGADSITNPESSLQPEIVSGMWSTDYDYVSLQQGSGLVAVGIYVLKWEDEYKQLMQLGAKASELFAQKHGLTKPFVIDIEWKKAKKPDGSARLELKQIRTVPMPKDAGDPEKVYLLSERVRLCNLMAGGFHSFDDFYPYTLGVHQLRAELEVVTSSGWLADFKQDAGKSFLKRLKGTYWLGNEQVDFDWQPAAIPGVQNSSGADDFGYQFLSTRWKEGIQTSDFRVSLWSPAPLGTMSSAGMLEWRSAYSQSVFGTPGKAAATSFYVCDDFKPAAVVETRTFTKGRVAVEARFHFATETVGKQESLLREWDGARITGLTSAPIELKAPLALSYAAGHHNFVEYLLFDPLRDPGVTAAQRQELKANDVRLIYGETTQNGGAGTNTLFYVGFDGVKRAAD